ncbi:MAG: hypothetical protein AAGH53_14050 [Pseudomonadota bacterium]
MPRRLVISFGVGAAISLVFAVAIAALAPQFAWDILLGDRPIMLFGTILVIASLAFTGWFFGVRRHFSETSAKPAHYRIALSIFVIGMVARLLLLHGPPILEDDHYRYLWDGAVTAEGLNPYSHPPADFATAPEVEALTQSLNVKAEPLPKGYETLAVAGNTTLLRVNNPHIATIYPPPVQAAFASAYRLSPFSLTAWRLVLLGFEILTFSFLYLALRAEGQGPFALTLYWWHPLVLKEFANSGHMDAMLIAALAVILWLFVSGRQRLTVIVIGVASAIKFWPAMLLPMLFQRSRIFWILAITGGATALALLLPQLLALDSEAGLVRYTADWQRNALLFPVLKHAVSWTGEGAGQLARFSVAILLLGIVFTIWDSRLSHRLGTIIGQSNAQWLEDPIVRSAVLVLLLCLFSPTGYPWYALWLLPFAVLRPKLLLAVLPACAGFYYFDFLIQAELVSPSWAIIPALLSAGPAIMVLLFSLFFHKNSQEAAYGLVSR